MALWLWIVVALVFGLIFWEFISWINRRFFMKKSEASAVEEAEDELQAELARAKMKIAVLQGRLEEAEQALEEESELLLAQYNKQLAQTEAAYQRQMVALAENLAENGKGDWRKAPPLKKSPAEEFPVRMEREIAAWRNGFEKKGEKNGNTGIVETALPDEANGDLLNAAMLSGASAESAGSEGTQQEPADEAGLPPDQDDAQQLEAQLLGQITVHDEIDGQDVESKTAVAAALAAGRLAADVPQSRPVPEAEEVELENRWPDLEAQAAERAKTRQLGTEMDADYLENEEFMREVGGAGNTQDWVVDPLQELAEHINGDAGAASQNQMEEPQRAAFEAPVKMQPADPNDWEELVYSSAEMARSHEEELEQAQAETVDAGFDEELSAEEAEIAAMVEAILARAPQETAVQTNDGGRDQARRETGGGAREANGYGRTQNAEGGTATIAAPSFIWERTPINWEAEYFDNTKLADSPVAVRQDDDIAFDWLDKAPVRGVQPRIFSVRWKGSLPLEEGQYRFTAQAPDGLRLWLNERLMISAWYDQSEQTYNRDVFWGGGTMDVRVEHYENGGDARAHLTWERIA